MATPASYLFTPGPVPIPEQVSRALQGPALHHRSQAFTELYREVQTGLRYFFQTQGLTGVFTAGGSAGIEMGMSSLFSPGEKVLVLDFGKFSQRWAAFAGFLGLELVSLSADWGKSPSTKQVLELAKQHPDLRGAVITHSETSTGALVDLEEMAFGLRQVHREIILLVDAITSAGALPYYHDAWGIDLSFSSSQKALKNPAGVMAYAMSERALSRLQITIEGDHSNLYYYAKAAQGHSHPFTAPAQLMLGINEALVEIKKEGLPQIWNRTQQQARLFRGLLAELGAQVFPEEPSPSLSAFTWPGKDLKWLQEWLVTEHRLLVAGGQGHLREKILRVSHLTDHPTETWESLFFALKHAANM